MTRALLWKEWREQGFVVLTLLVAGCGLLIGAYTLLDPPRDSGGGANLRSVWFGGRLALFLMAITTGLIVGASLFAGEREAGTFAFLDLLPGSRWSRWWRKVVMGAVLTSFPVLAFLTLAAALGISGTDNQLVIWTVLVILITAIAYGWGCFGSVFGSTSMSAIGYAILGSALAAILALLGSSLVLYLATEVFGIISRRQSSAIPILGTVCLFTLFFLPLGLSALFFTAPDRGRHLRAVDIDIPKLGEVRRRTMRRVFSLNPLNWFPGWRRMLWLSCRQFFLQLFVSVVMAIICGLVLLVNEISAVIIYPIPSLLIGLVIGVSLWADEQQGQSLRFWAERRLPTGRLWAAKHLSGLVMLLLGNLILLIPLFIRWQQLRLRGPLSETIFLSGVAIDWSFPILQYLLMWPLYGLVFGSLFGMLFRKSIVAGAVGIMVAAIFAAAWFPSFLMGGLRPWQWLIPLFVTLSLSRLLIWPTVTDRLAGRTAVLRIILGTFVLLSTMFYGLAYRVLSTPLVAGHDDDIVFAAKIPTFDLEQPGRDIRRVLPRTEQIVQADKAFPVPLLYPDDPEFRDLLTHQLRINPAAEQAALEAPFTAQLRSVLRQGLPYDRPDFTQWLVTVPTDLDANGEPMLIPEWERLLASAAKKPVGVLDDPTEVVIGTPLRYYGKLVPLFQLYLVRGLHFQREGDPAEFLDRFEVTLKLLRTVRNQTYAMNVAEAAAIEADAMQALDRWLEELPAIRSDLLQRALALLVERDTWAEPDPYESHLAMQATIRTSFRSPNQWLPSLLDGSVYGPRIPVNPTAVEMEVSVLSFAAAVPWEEERIRRIIGFNNRIAQNPRGIAALDRYPLPGGLLMLDRVPSALFEPNQIALQQTLRRTALLKVAVRLHLAKAGQMPSRAEELVEAKVIAKLPQDPFDQQPLRYRLSAGETIQQLTDLAAQANARQFGGMGIFMPGDENGLSSFEFRNWELQDFPPFAAMAGTPMAALVFQWDTERDQPVLQQILAEQAKARLDVPKGQAVIWSVGLDRVDDRGQINLAGANIRMIQQGSGDLVYLVPLPLRLKK